jgi:hypothetical protein
MDVACPHFQTCPICGSSEKVKLLWIIAYCKTRRHEECARFLLRRNGDAVPFTLLPDGSHMSPEIEAAVRAHIEECKQAEGR